MPSTFQRLAVDFDGDGRRDIVGSVPDALASTANYLKQAGWITGAPWGYEVRVPANYSGPSGRRTRKPLDEWRQLGIKTVAGEPLTGTGGAALLLPAGKEGPAFIVFRTRLRLRISLTACVAAVHSRRRGRPMIRGCRAPSGANCRSCSSGTATTSARSTG
jgi:hypothetical protein